MKKAHVSSPSIQAHFNSYHLAGSLLMFTTFAASISLLVSFTGSISMAPSLNDSIKDLKRSTERITRYQSHHTFLSRCLEHHIIPKGMSLKFGKDALPKVDFLHKTISNTMIAANVEIVSACSNTYESLVETERLSLHKILYDIYQSSSYYEFEATRRLHLSNFSSLKQKLAKKKGKKFSGLLARTPDHNTHTHPSKRKCRRFKHRTKTTAHLDPASSPTRESNSEAGQSQGAVINLSQVHFSPDQLKLLALGPKFCPTPRTLDKQRLQEDVREGCRRLRLKEMFHDPDKEEQQPPRFYKKTFYTPPLGRDVALDAYCDVIQKHTSNYDDHRKPKDNLTSPERKALSELQQMNCQDQLG